MLKTICLLSSLLATIACIQAPPSRPAPNVLEVGSSKGSVVAMNVSGVLPLLFLTSALGDAAIAEHKLKTPNVEFVTGLSAKQALARASEFHAVDAHLLSPEFLDAATNLHWVQSWSAGVDRYVGPEGLAGLVENDQVVLTNMKGIHGPVIAEHVMATLLSLSRDLPAYHVAQQNKTWDRSAGSGQRALAGSTLLVVGMGGIGTEVARRAHGFDMRVLATVRTARKTPSYVSELGTADALERFLPLADTVVICLPLTGETRGMFDAALIAKMKPDSILVNIARGAIVDTDALLAALESGHVAGAALDVTDPEPLPSSSPLWLRSDVVITPHTAGMAELTGTRRDVLFSENLHRFAEGRPLLNVVDKAAGY